GGGLLEEQRAFGDLAGKVLFARGGALAADLVVPGGEAVGEGADLEGPDAFAVGGEGADPAVAVDLAVDPCHRRLLPLAARRAEAEQRADLVVAVAEDFGRGDDRLPQRPLDVESPAVDRGLYVEDADPRRRGERLLHDGLRIHHNLWLNLFGHDRRGTRGRHPHRRQWAGEQAGDGLEEAVGQSAENGYWHREPHISPQSTRW